MKFSQPARRPVAIELAAIVDVTFLLLIFLLLTTRFANEAQLRISLPQAAGMEQPAGRQQLEVVIDARGRYWVEGLPVQPPSLKNLMRDIQSLSGGNRDLKIEIRADERAEYRDVIKAMDAASRLGFSRVNLDVRQPDSKKDTGEW
ncbi:MAG: ExbD/TolR family protein [Gammaproteobacteria bacterium]